MSEVFTRTDFLDVFVRYNMAVGIAPSALMLLALIGLGAITWKWRFRQVYVGVMLGLLWIWAGMVYHWGFFADINPAAVIFGAVFIGQGAAFIRYGAWSNELTFDRPGKDARGVAGLIVTIYALVLYPLMSVAAGHAWPAMPTFGAPCPVALFTCGLLLWAHRPVPRILLIVPAAWALLTSLVAFEFGMQEDWGLLIAAGVMVSWLWRRTSDSRQPRGHLRIANTVAHRIWRRTARNQRACAAPASP